MGKKSKTEQASKKRSKKDKNAPKRPISAYFFYNQERRESLKKEKPTLNNKDLIRVMSEEWNKLNDEQKKPYMKKAEDDKKRYLEEMKEYEKHEKED